MKTLYLHIGTPKTATTSIQMFCVVNQELLHTKGYSYPVLDFKYPHVMIRRNGHFLVGRLNYPNGEENVELEEELWARGLKLVHTEFEKYSNVILSDENIWHSSMGDKYAFWERLKKDAEEQGYRIKVVVYLRRQDGMAISWLSQQVKEAWNHSSYMKWTSFKKRPRNIMLDYYSLLEKIAQVTGRENIIVRAFERSKFKGNGNTIFSDFLEAIGLEYTDEYKIEEEEANKSLTGNSQEIMRIVNSVLPDDVKIRALMRRAAHRCEELKDVDNSFTMFTKEELEEFMERYREGNDRIAKEYLGQEETLFDTKLKDGECWTPDNRFMYEDIIRFFGNILVEQEKHIVALEKDMKTMQDSRLESIQALLQELGDGKDVSENIEKYQALSEQVINQQKDLEAVFKKSEKMGVAEEQIHSLSVKDQMIKDEVYELRTELKALRKELKEVEKTAMLFRVRRKMNSMKKENKKA